jgi:hypothetical protein
MVGRVVCWAENMAHLTAFEMLVGSLCGVMMEFPVQGRLYESRRAPNGVSSVCSV